MTATTIARIQPALPKKRVCVAGAVLEPMDQWVSANTRERRVEGQVLSWRGELFQVQKLWDYDLSDAAVGRFHYAGPTIEASHGFGSQDLASKCLREVERADVLFAWIDRADTLGTLAEIGAAYALGKPTFVAFANQSLTFRFYFAKQLATVAIVVSTAHKAWEVFTKWQDVLDLSV